MKKILILALGLILTSGAYAQREETLFNQTRLDLTGFWFSDSHNFTFLEDDTEYFTGGNFAIDSWFFFLSDSNISFNNLGLEPW